MSKNSKGCVPQNLSTAEFLIDMHARFLRGVNLSHAANEALILDKIAKSESAHVRARGQPKVSLF